MPYLVQTSRINSSRTRYVYLAANSSNTTSELQRHAGIDMDIIQCDELGAKVPGHRQEQLLQTFDVRLLKRTCFCCSNWESHCSILPGGR